MNATCAECGAQFDPVDPFYMLEVDDEDYGDEMAWLRFCGPTCLAQWAARLCNYMLIGEGQVLS